MRLRLYWDTVRHLRPRQLLDRAEFRLHRPRPHLRPAPGLAAHPLCSLWTAPVARPASQTGPRSFRFLNMERSLARHGWDDPALDRLWRYHLHYCDDLSTAGTAERTAAGAALIADWIAGNPPGAGTGWEPYPVSRRIVNWVKWALAGNTLSPEALDSLAVQARWLTRRLERHLSGNHLLANAKALVFAGCIFSGGEADGWRRLGLELLAREIAVQILPDGGHYELSPMYHALVLEDLLDLVNLLRAAGRETPRDWIDRLPVMLDWLASLSHPDGEIAFFNDATTGAAPTLADLDAYAGRLGLEPPRRAVRGLRRLADSGYVRLQGPRAVVLLDAARVGPDHQPGHAHADTLSFELSLDGQRVLVNGGVSHYGDDAERLRQRGTAAHNTVVVNGRDSSEVWSGFRVARRARPFDLETWDSDAACGVVCAHDGYRRLRGRPVHRREWRLRPDGLAVTDRVEGAHDTAEALFHLHPAIGAHMAADGRSGTLFPPSGRPLAWRAAEGRVRLEAAVWNPAFGVRRPALRLVLTLAGGAGRMLFDWSAAGGAGGYAD